MEIPIPTTRDVGRILRARTRDQYGNLIADFTDETTPDAAGALGEIREAVDEISEALGNDIPQELMGPAKRVITLLAAANIELSYFPEQAAQNNSMYDKLMARITTLRMSLINDFDEISDMGHQLDSPHGTFDFPSSYGWDGVSW